MGAAQTKATSVKNVLNAMSMEVLQKHSKSTEATIDQTNKVVITDVRNSKVTGITQINSAKINVSALREAVVSGDIQSDLTNTITERMTQEASGLGYSTAESDLRTNVSNVINSKMTVENMDRIRVGVLQSNTTIIANVDASTVSNILTRNEAEMIISLVDEMNTEIVNKMSTKSKVSTTADQKATAVGFGSIMGIILIIVLFVAIGGAVFTYGPRKMLGMVTGMFSTPKPAVR
jgi:hypothetical protein